MSKERLSIQELIALSDFKEKVEIIEVPLEGDSIVLLRTKTMPECAFLMWAKRDTGTQAQISFKMPLNGYSDYYAVVCACCPLSDAVVNGIKTRIPNYDDDSSNDEFIQKKEEKTIELINVLVNACKDNDINSVFMRRASLWDGYEDNLKGVKVIEAINHKDTFLDWYGRLVVDANLSFIYYIRSKGIERIT